MKEILKLTPAEGRQIVQEDHEGFEYVRQQIIDTTRWSIVYEMVVMRVSDGKFFKTKYSTGATESQAEEPYQYAKEAVFTEVVPVEKTIIVYE